MKKYFRKAIKRAQKGSVIRRYNIGAVGVRTDGTIVSSANIPCKFPTPEAHAESRVCRKLDHGSVVYVVRVLSNGGLALARPCSDCLTIMKNRGIKKCYYSINNNEYGVIVF